MDLSKEKRFKFRLRLEKEQAALKSQAVTPPQESEGLLDTMGRAADTINESIPYAAGLMAPPLGLAQLAGQKINEAAGQVAEPVTEMAGRGIQVGNRRIQAPGPLAAGIGTLASIAINPLTYVNPEAGISTKLDPVKGKPGYAARIKQMRTGVEASNFERLRRDPTAFFSRTPREEAGAAVGQAKAEAGINPGVTKDPASLTPENIQKARSPMVSANQAQDQIVADLGAARELLGPGASMEELIQTAGITPDQTATALKGLNKRLTKIERAEGAGSESFRDFSAIKDHFQTILEQVAPDVRQANKEFSRVALRDKFMEPFPVNQAGTFSKINAFGFSPAMGAAAALFGGPGVGMATMAGAQAFRSPFVAGLGTATRGLIDKMVDPALSGTANRLAGQGGLIGTMTERRNRISKYIDRVIENRR